MKPIEWGKSFTGDDLPPGPNDDFYTGVKLSWDWYQGNLGFLLDAYREFGPVFTTRMMGMKIVWIIGAEANQRMYVDDWREFHWWGESIHGQLAGLIGEGLLASDGETHDKARRLLDPVFSKTNLKKFVKTMIDETESQVQQFRDGEQLDFYEWVYDLALDNASACFMGMDSDRVDTETLHKNFDICVEYYQEPIHVQALRGPGTPYWYFKKAKNKIDNVLEEEIQDRRRQTDLADDNILDRLLEAEVDGETFTDDEIHDQILNLYWAGHDTTISAISWLIMLVGKYPEVYERLQTEVDERVGDAPVETEEVIEGLPYMEMVMDETLRLYPPAWVAFRKSQSDIDIYGHTIPADTEVAFSSFATHRLPHLFENPEAFNPERMKPENQRDFPPGAYIPFARGPRTCIGMNFAKYEIKLIVATLLRHFDYELMPGQKYRGYPVATLTPDEVLIELNRRNGGNTSAVGAGSSIEQPGTPGSVDDAQSGPDTSGSSGCPVH
ncbi:MAG: cytochrome P450 [bacterium]